jgi:hypothetical protein
MEKAAAPLLNLACQVGNNQTASWSHGDKCYGVKIPKKDVPSDSTRDAEQCL